MPATLRNVAKTDTLETQRQKINLLAQDVYNIGSGGSDLSAGNIKLGDGTRVAPSLSFSSDSSLGIYKSSAKSIGYVVDGKKLLDIKNDRTISYKDVILQKNILLTSGLTTLNSGSGYDPGSYTNIQVLGGSGDLGTFNIIVSAFSGSVTNTGSNYKSGSFAGVRLSGGTGSGATISFSVDALSGNVTSSGSNYGDGATTLYENIPFTGGSGSGAIGSFNVNPTTGQILSVFVTNNGSGYLKNDVLSVNNSNFSNNGSGFQYTITTDPGIVKNVNFSTKGSGYSVNDVLTLPAPVQNVSTTLNSTQSTIVVSSTSGIIPGSTVTQTSGSGVLAAGTTVSFIDTNTNTITLSANPTTSGSAVLTFTPPYYGSPTTNFAYTVNSVGAVESYTVNSSGNGYQVDDLLSVSPSSLTQPITYPVVVKNVQLITLTTTIPSSTFTTLDTITFGSFVGNIYQVNSSGGNITSLLIDNISLLTGSNFTKTGSPTTYTVNTVSSEYRFFINTGSGSQLTPIITLYSGDTYIFDLSDSTNSAHKFSLSKYRDGIWGPSLIQNVTTTLSSTSKQIVVTDTTGILEGMEVSTTSIGGGSLPANTTVSSVVNSTTLLLSNFPTQSGAATLRFRGVEYVDGVTRSSNSLRIVVTENTPNLYYYCGIENSAHQNEGGSDLNEATVTINTNNPRVFGSGFSARVSEVTSQNIISASVSSGEIQCLTLRSNNSFFNSSNITGTLTASTVNSTNISTSSISSSSNLSISANTAVNISSNVNIGSTISLQNSDGNITTSGILKTSNSLNVNDRLILTNNIISSTSGNNIVLTPFAGRVAKIDTTSAITIPSGTTAQRPSSAVVESGSIRFNTDTGQYEGYSASTSSWSSLGGVRDLDGNTYITAEASIGANDNTLYFYNDGNNSIKVSPSQFTFNTVKTISSPNPLNPPSTQWSANTPVTLGSYVFWNNNLYEVTTAGTTGTSGNEPTHTTGVQTNGTSQLTWYTYYSDDITFNQVNNVKIVNNLLLFNDSSNVYDLKLSSNKISSNLSDIIIEPFAGKKVDINTNTSLVLPNGTTAERGIPGQGSVRFNTSLSQFEGYNGINWTSLGGVRDVDGNTYIIPETSPGSNENILYFYNNGSNTLRLSTTELTFNTIDQIGSSSNNLDLQASTVTFNNLSLTLDTSSISTNRLLSTKTNFDVALSSGLTTDSLLRLTNDGDIYINKAFGTGSDNLIKVLDNELNRFELDDVIIESSEYTLTKGTTNSGASVIFNPTLHTGAKVVLIVDNTTINDREMIEFTVISKGTDIFHTEYGNVVSNGDIVTPTFDFDASNNVRLNTALVSGVAAGNVVNVTVVSTVIKK